MNAYKLKLFAELLECEIQSNLGKSRDVDWLALYPPLLDAIKDAKDGAIDRPLNLGLGRWALESNIQDFDVLSEMLAQFSLLLRGWDELPSDGGVD